MNRVALVSTPWPLYKRPSIQLGSLKAYLKQHLKDIRVDAFHLYLDVAASIGFEVYSVVSESSWLSEALYGGLLFPDKKESSDRLVERLKRKNSQLKHMNADIVRAELANCLEKHMKEINWAQYALIGFSICFSQLMSSLLYMKKIKELCPNSIIIAGGSHCSDKMGKTLIETFHFIDLVVEGEGERPLLEICKHLREGRDLKELANIPGTVSRESTPAGPCQLQDLSVLPPPDYDDYFMHIKRFPQEKRFFAHIPIEGSRGCWYRGRSDKGCAFCNLNLQWRGYRRKRNEQVVSEIEDYIKRYRTVFFSFMDNLIPKEFLPELFEKLKAQGRDLRIFLETRSGISLDALRKMKEAGVENIQVGLEALSSRLLKKMRKGTTAIQNIEIMKLCERADTPTLTSNLILDFPSSDEEDVKETIYNMEFVRHLKPLKPIPFWLGYGSLVYSCSSDYGIRKVFNHQYYSFFIPEGILKNLVLMIQSYKLRNPKNDIWKAVKKYIKDWQTKYETLKKQSSPILAFYDARDFLIIIERKAANKENIHRLVGKSRDIYLFCESRRHIKEILTAFHEFSYEQIKVYLDELVSKRLMFKEGEEYLSLAIRTNTS